MHMNEKTFRVVLRSSAQPEEADGFCVDFVVTDFVLVNFFQVCSRQYLICQKMMMDGYKPSQEEMHIMKGLIETSFRCIWLLPIADKKVREGHAG